VGAIVDVGKTVNALAVFVFTSFANVEYNVSNIPLFTILLVVIAVLVGKDDVGKFTLYELLPVNAFVPDNETDPPVETAVSTYSLVHKTLLAFISANRALHITFL